MKRSTIKMGKKKVKAVEEKQSAMIKIELNRFVNRMPKYMCGQ